MMAWTRHGAPSAAPAPVSLALVLAMSLAACCRAQVHPGVDGLLSPEIKKQMEVPNTIKAQEDQASVTAAPNESHCEATHSAGCESGVKLRGSASLGTPQ